jgi:hypothetical protein
MLAASCLVHANRMKPRRSPSRSPENVARDGDSMSRNELRRGVEAALCALGRGFLQHPDNRALRRSLARGELSPRDYFNQLLGLVYRLIFLFTVEERDLLHPEDSHRSAKERYAKGYGVTRLRARPLAAHERDAGSEIWENLKVVFRSLATGAPELALPALAGIFASDRCPVFDAEKHGASLQNEVISDALRRLSWLESEKGPVVVHWGALKPEELGSVYETLLELRPEISDDGRSFALCENGAEAHARRSSGSYYTPDSLVSTLLARTLDPIVEETLASKPADPVRALLNLSIVDPACGSGHFLLAAGRRLALYVARAAGHDSPSPTALRHALRQVIGRCLYGVDLNPLAVELCKVSLWLEAFEPGHPLSFLDSHIHVGNALVGASRERIEAGIPDAAWEPGKDHDPKAPRRRKRRNQKQNAPHELSGETLPLLLSPRTHPSALARESLQDETLLDVELKASEWKAYLESEALEHAASVANLWCSTFFWHAPALTSPVEPPNNDTLLAVCNHPKSVSAPVRREVARLASEHRFFHWPLAFPHVFARGGFDVVLGNPPWIAHAGRAAQPLPSGLRRFYKASYRTFAGYPTTHGMFVALGPSVLRPGGALGFIVPSSVSELPKYEPTRRAHDALCDFGAPLIDFGEGQFLGVTQPCMALVSKRTDGGRQSDLPGSPWPMERPDLNEVARAVLARLDEFSPLPPELFGERGFQSDVEARAHFRALSAPKGRFTLPLREGTDVREFRLLPPRVHADPKALRGRIRSDEDFRSVRIVVRNTARYPIAALSDGTPFRNSLLAGFSSDEWPAEALVAYLNSSLVRWRHYVKNRDARQPVLPQVKIGHLRTIPAPKLTAKSKKLLTQIGKRLSSSVPPLDERERSNLDQIVFDAFALTEEGRALIVSWHREVHTSNRRQARKARRRTRIDRKS